MEELRKTFRCCILDNWFEDPCSNSVQIMKLNMQFSPSSYYFLQPKYLSQHPVLKLVIATKGDNFMQLLQYYFGCINGMCIVNKK
jgi:hypothetical protein